MTSLDLGRIQAVTLDAAGTLLEPTPSVGAIYAEVAAELGWTHWQPAELDARFRAVWSAKGAFDFSAVSWLNLVTQVTEGLAPEPLSLRYFPLVWERFNAARCWHVYPEVPAVLNRLREQGWRLAVVSNWDERLHRVLQVTGLAPSFEFILPSTEAARPKPDPGIFRQAAQRLGVEVANLLHVGDSRREDWEGATAAGAQALLVDRRTPPNPTALPSLESLPQQLQYANPPAKGDLFLKAVR